MRPPRPLRRTRDLFTLNALSDQKKDDQKKVVKSRQTVELTLPSPLFQKIVIKTSFQNLIIVLYLNK